jgi:hypothetical protein
VTRCDTMIPSLQDIEQYFESVETYVFSSVYVPQLNDVREAANRLWLDVSRHGPNGLSSLPDIIPSLGDFAVPPPPPPPPAPESSWFDDAAEWVAENPRTASGALVVVVGGSLVAAYGVRYARHARIRRLKASLVAERRQIVGTSNVADLYLVGVPTDRALNVQWCWEVIRRWRSP